MPGRGGGFMPEIMLQATHFRTLVSAKTSVRIILCEGKVIRSKQNIILSSVVSEYNYLSDLGRRPPSH